MNSQYLIEQDPFLDTRERLIVEEYVLIHKKKLLKKKTTANLSVLYCYTIIFWLGQ